MSRLVHRNLKRSYPLAVSGAGLELRAGDQRSYLDACGGAAVSCLGHGHPHVIAAMERQLRSVDYVHTSFFSTEPAERLAEHLVARAPKGITHVSLVSGGSEAMETALKLARQAAVERGEAGREIVISRRQSYHGNTLGALSVSGNVNRRQLYAPLLFPAQFIGPCFAFRYAEPGESLEAYGARAAAELESAIVEAGPDSVLAFVAETVVGATSGAVAAAPGYFRKVREICDRYGVLLILDEVMCGMGRTGTLHACEQEGIAPDLMTIAKGLGAGAAPIGAVLVGARVHDAIAGGSGIYQHGFTYMGHPLAAAAALAVQEVIEREDLIANVTRRGAELAALLAERIGGHRHVGDIRGRGLFIGIEFVADRQTMAPFAPAMKVNRLVQDAAMAEGLMVYAMSGTIDGVSGDHVMLAPPFTIDGPAVEAIVERLTRAVTIAMTTELGRSAVSA
jgi:adenosylmethionine-8-amino-7-oxononanoate aminotransferase